MPRDQALSPDTATLKALRLVVERGPLTGPQLDDLMAADGYSATAVTKAVERLRGSGRIHRSQEGYQATTKGRAIIVSFDAGATLRAQAEAKRAARQATR